jgi:hypothetical protein
MADTIPVKCPNCTKAMNVPLSVAGKKIRCKDCQSVLTVPANVPKAPEPAAKSPFADDDDDKTAYGAQKDDLDIPRCPFCTRELDPPDTKICLNCGYDLIQRRRHESKKVHAHTTGDYFKYHLMTIVSFIIVCTVIAVMVIAFKKMGGMLEEIGLRNDQEDPITKQKGWIVPPGACLTPMTVISLYIIYRSGSFVFKRLVYKFKPPEITKKDEE